MVLELHTPNIPKQDRSLKRYKNALQTADLILAEKGIHAVTIKEIAKLSGLKRSSLYKFFPSNLAILYALSEQHLNKLLDMLDANILNASFDKSSDFINLIIDLLSIYLNEQKGSSIIFLSRDFPATLELSIYSKNLLDAQIIKKINQKNTKINNERITNILSIIVSLLSQGFSEEGLISPRIINETKRASLAYLAAY
tara:strand:+ start:44 stop:637 length:594 start_codon:yes stop_codon:yes gene_type:complete